MTKFKNHQVRTTWFIIIFFVVVTILGALFAENPIPAYVILAFAATSGFFSIYSGKNVKEIQIGEEKIIVLYYDRPFRLKRHELNPQGVLFRYDYRMVGSLTWANRICAEDLNGTKLFIISTNLGLWEESQITDIELIIYEKLQKKIQGKRMRGIGEN